MVASPSRVAFCSSLIAIAAAASSAHVSAQAYGPDILQARIASSIEIAIDPKFRVTAEAAGSPKAEAAPRSVQRAAAVGDCATLFFVEDANYQVSTVTTRWSDVRDVRVAAKTVSWRESGKRYDVELGSPSSAGNFLEDVQALVKACSAR